MMKKLMFILIVLNLMIVMLVAFAGGNGVETGQL